MSHAIQKRFTSLEKGMDAPWGNSCCDLALYKIELNWIYNIISAVHRTQYRRLECNTEYFQYRNAEMN